MACFQKDVDIDKDGITSSHSWPEMFDMIRCAIFYGKQGVYFAATACCI